MININYFSTTEPILDQLPVFYPQSDPLWALPGPKTNYMININNFSTTEPILDLDVSLYMTC